MFLCVPNADEDWTRLCQSLEATELRNDARLRAPEKRRKNTKRLIAQAGQDDQATERCRVDGALDARRCRPIQSVPIWQRIRRPGRMTTPSKLIARRSSVR